MPLDTLNDLYVDQIQDLYSAETQIADALPKMIDRASHAKLRDGFTRHLEQTRQHVKRVEAIAKRLGADTRAKTCKGMEGLIKESSEILMAKGHKDVIDAALIAAAQRVEHYEVAAYGCARAFAQALGRDEDVVTLQSMLTAEREANDNLTRVAESIVNLDAQRTIAVDREVKSPAAREGDRARRDQREDRETRS